jgi:hypothetical protein
MRSKCVEIAVPRVPLFAHRFTELGEPRHSVALRRQPAES